MSKKNNEKKEAEVPKDHITEVKNLHYTINLREEEIRDLKYSNSSLIDKINQLEKYNNDLKASWVLSYKNEKELKSLKDLYDNCEKENRKLKR